MNLATKIVTALGAVSNHPLYRHRRGRGLAEFVWAQCSSRLRRGDIIVDFPDRTRLAVAPWAKGAAHFIFPRLCEFDEMAFVVHFLRAGDLFVDIGANIGAYTVLGGGVAGASVLAVEPSHRTFQQLRKNVELNRLTERVTLLNAALGREAGVSRLTDDLGTENYIVTDPGAGTEVPVVPLDDQLKGRVPALIKMDVEGFETEVFAGAGRTLASFQLAAMVVERNNSGARYGFDEAALHERLRRHGFQPYAYRALERRLLPLKPEDQGNLIYLRDPAKAQAILMSAPSFRIAGMAV